MARETRRVRKDNANLNYLHVRLQGMEQDVELTPGYKAWREEVTRDARFAETEKAKERERLERRLGNTAVEE